jgi:hypothetical protein
MKYLITESRYNKVIKQFIESRYDNIVSVSFEDTSVWLASENKSHSRTLIKIIIDPHKILDGNINGNFIGYNRNLRIDIWNDLNKLFNLKLDKYGSDWDIAIYGVKLEPI